MISSAVAREGTTTAAVHICRHLRRDFGLNPLLIEANRVRPSLTRLFDLDDRKSMATILSYDGSARECVQHDPTGLAMIPAGDCSTSFLLPSLESTLGHAVDELKSSFDFMLVDVPPILESPDVLLAGRVIPQLVLVVAAGQASGESLDRACQELREANITVVGTILNSRKRIIPKWIERWL
jgi:succinoglycan biosynthesis transport protein ExoP